MSETKMCPMDVIVTDQRTNLFLLGTKLSDTEIVRNLVEIYSNERGWVGKLAQLVIYTTN